MAHASLPLNLDIDTLHVTVRSVDLRQPWVWLRRGWEDLKKDFGTSVLYGVFFAAVGFLILSFAANLPHLFTAATSGFMLIGPLAGAGLYEISRRGEQGLRTSFDESLRGLTRNRASLLQFGLILLLAVIGWERASAILFALLGSNQPVSMEHYWRDVFFSGDHLPFVIAYVGIGGMLAAVLYTVSVVSVPMLIDRETNIVSAMIVSARAVTHNLGAMLLWAAMLAGMMLIGFATWMVGMIILLPLAGHASWHAYRDLVHHAN